MRLLTGHGTLLRLDRVDGNERHRGAMKLLLAEILDVLSIGRFPCRLSVFLGEDGVIVAIGGAGVNLARFQ